MRSSLFRRPRGDEISARLSEFLDGDLDEGARHEIALHLAACEACAQLEADLAATVHALHALRSPHDREAATR